MNEGIRRLMHLGSLSVDLASTAMKNVEVYSIDA